MSAKSKPNCPPPTQVTVAWFWDQLAHRWAADWAEPGSDKRRCAMAVNNGIFRHRYVVYRAEETPQ